MSGTANVEFVSDRVALRQVFLNVLQFPPSKPQSIPAAHTYSFTCHQCCIVSVRYHQFHYTQSSFLKEEEEKEEKERKDIEKENNECLRKDTSFGSFELRTVLFWVITQ
jgi:hypothetical protein